MCAIFIDTSTSPLAEQVHGGGSGSTTEAPPAIRSLLKTMGGNGASDGIARVAQYAMRRADRPAPMFSLRQRRWHTGRESGRIQRC